MNSPWLAAIFAVVTLYLGLPLPRVLRILMRLLAALLAGVVKWPGPSARELDPNVTQGRLKIGWPASHLFSVFAGYGAGLAGAFVFFLILFLSSTSLLAAYVQLRWSWAWPIVIIGAFIGGTLGLTRAVHYGKQVEMLLADLATGAEPRQIGGASPEAEYAIEHPLAEGRAPPSAFARALALFSESTRLFQDGNEGQARLLYQAALEADPALHQHAREGLAQRLVGCGPKQAGPIYYWLAAHAEYLSNWKEAAAGYGQAIQAFSQIGYHKREARAHCNLGNVKMHMRDESAMEEFEKAVALNPRNGTAYLNIARTYYLISEPGEPWYELALDAFANAIVADPQFYGPRVIASLREFGYTWKEDLEQITHRVERKRRPADSAREGKRQA